MAVRLIYESAAGQFNAAIVAAGVRMATAATAAITDVTNDAKIAARAAIAAGGLSSKWQNALRSKVFPQGGVSLNPSGFIYSKIPYADVFQTGATIAGKKNLLWLPLPDAPRISGQHALTPAQYIKIVGPLRSLNVPGKLPMLAGRVARISNRQGAGRFGPKKLKFRNFRARRAFASKPFVPLYVGVPIVVLPQKFDVKTPIALVVASKLNDTYLKKLESA